MYEVGARGGFPCFNIAKSIPTPVPPSWREMVDFTILGGGGVGGNVKNESDKALLT